ncbi:MAG: hypothetical protein IJ091_04280 [Oscillospiraceae bacterium]|nr:hypothetical protein [Oscillospiraceae bacterium]
MMNRNIYYSPYGGHGPGGHGMGHGPIGHGAHGMRCQGPMHPGMHGPEMGRMRAGHPRMGHNVPPRHFRNPAVFHPLFIGNPYPHYGYGYKRHGGGCLGIVFVLLILAFFLHI